MMKKNIVFAVALGIVLMTLIGCAAPFKSKPLIDSQLLAKQDKNINFKVIDVRNDKNTLKGFSAKPSYIIYGDDSFDKSLYDIFNEMIVNRFGNDPNGFLVEIKLKVFSPRIYTHMVGPVIHRIECKSLLTADVGFINNENKYIFNKTYLVESSDVAKGNSIVRDVLMDTLKKAFNEFAHEFEIDIDRVFIEKAEN